MKSVKSTTKTHHTYLEDRIKTAHTYYDNFANCVFSIYIVHYLAIILIRPLSIIELHSFHNYITFTLVLGLTFKLYTTH